MFTVERKALRFTAQREPGRSRVLNSLVSFLGMYRNVVTESWCVLDPKGTLVCMCVCENDANMIEISLNEAAK